MRILCLLAAIVVALTGCGNQQTQFDGPEQGIQLKALPCSYPDSTTDSAPLWICESKVMGLKMQAMGVSEDSRAGISHQRQLALLDAQNVLALQLDSRIKGAIKRYSASKANSSEQYMASSSEVKFVAEIDKQIFDMTIYQSVISPKGAFYILVGLNDEAYKSNVETKLHTSISGQPTLDGSSHDELVNAISGYLDQ